MPTIRELTEGELERIPEIDVSEEGSAVYVQHGERLVGFAVLRVRLTDDAAQLAGLYVDRAWRRRGVASALVEVVASEARSGGATMLYVSAVPSDSAVGFYLSRGFEPTADPHPALFELEPEDVHMLLAL